MSIPKSVDLILKAGKLSGKLSKYGEIFILKMPAINIMDLAKIMIKHLNTNNENKKDIQIKIVGKRPGEKLYEELMTDLESEQAYENNEMFVINFINPYDEFIPFSMPKGFIKTTRKKYLSSDEKLLSENEIFDILKTNDLWEEEHC